MSFVELIGPLDPTHPQPLYQQLQSALREAIERKILGPNDALPAERGIGAELGISRITVRKALLARGSRPHSEWLGRSEGAVRPEESLMLGLSPGAAVYRFNRVRFADGQPMALEYSTIPAIYLPSPTAVEDSLYKALEDAGHPPLRALQRLSAVLFTPDQAKILGVPPYDAGLLIERRAFLASGKAVEFTRSFYRGDTYDFVAELSAS